MPQFNEFSQEEMAELNPLQLAYIGDSVYDLMVKSSLLKEKRKLHVMHLTATGKVNAVSQAKTLQKILPYLSEEELDYVRRGKNAHARHSAPKNATLADYAAATGLETLFGFLYIKGKEARLQEIYNLSQIDE